MSSIATDDRLGVDPPNSTLCGEVIAVGLVAATAEMLTAGDESLCETGSLGILGGTVSAAMGSAIGGAGMGVGVGATATGCGPTATVGASSFDASSTDVGCVDSTAPPELRITTPGATSLVCVISDEERGDPAATLEAASGAPVACEPLADDPFTDDVGGEAGVASAGLTPPSTVGVDSDGEPGGGLLPEGVSAHAVPGEVTTAKPTPSATANAPTRPTYREWPAFHALTPPAR